MTRPNLGPNSAPWGNEVNHRLSRLEGRNTSARQQNIAAGDNLGIPISPVRTEVELIQMTARALSSSGSESIAVNGPSWATQVVSLNLSATTSNPGMFSSAGEVVVRFRNPAFSGSDPFDLYPVVAYWLGDADVMSFYPVSWGERNLILETAWVGLSSDAHLDIGLLVVWSA